MKRLLAADDAPLPTPPLADDVALILPSSGLVEQPQQLPPGLRPRTRDGVLALREPGLARGLVLALGLDGVAALLFF